MRGRVNITAAAAFVLLAGCLAPSARGVIFYSTADPTYNTSAPTGSLAGSGWQWVGIWGGYEGTPIGPHHFITSQHIGGNVGETFTFGGSPYQTTAYFDDPSTDLRIWEVNGTFPSWAPLYRQCAEVGQGLVVIGEGVGRGDPVVVGGVTKGWMWGSNAGSMRWGQNTIEATFSGVPTYGFLLYAPFQAGAGPNEADLAIGDSSSPVFINDGSGWKLAGVAAVVDGPFNTTDTGAGFNAAIFDESGLYVQDNGSWTLVSGPGPVPSGFYASRISQRLAWIDSIVPPEGACSDSPIFSGTESAILMAAVALAGANLACRAALARARI
jgi:hypothetical protein